MHQSVLLHEVIEGLRVAEGDTFVDATFGGGGHSRKLCPHLGARGVLVGLDADRTAIERGVEILEGCPATIFLRKANFRHLDQVLAELSLAEADKYLFDLGWSSIQLEASGRGFSFRKDEPLLMTLSADVAGETLTARRIVNDWDEGHLETIIRSYGEERFARRIAQAIGAARQERPIETSGALAEIISAAVPGWYRHRRVHPATKTFQALRITVNDEIAALEEGLRHAHEHLHTSGRIAVISFHSLEDRIVKRFFRDLKTAGKGEVLTKRPIVPSREEIEENPRARSAKLRIFEKH